MMMTDYDAFRPVGRAWAAVAIRRGRQFAQAADMVRLRPGQFAESIFPWAALPASRTTCWPRTAACRMDRRAGIVLRDVIIELMAHREVPVQRSDRRHGSQQGLDLVARVLLDPRDVAAGAAVHTGAISASATPASLVASREADGRLAALITLSRLVRERAGREVPTWCSISRTHGPDRRGEAPAAARVGRATC